MDRLGTARGRFFQVQPMMVDESDWQTLTPDQMLREAGAWVSAEELDYSSDAKTVQVSGGERTVADGPSTSVKHQLGGFWIIETESMDQAVGWAQKVPMTNGSVEVRELVPEDGPS